ncbi:MAG: amidohydrolase family protein [Roseovarius sp.]|nr:amidohydrolase family protein [Roseovarius sp.]
MRQIDQDILRVRGVLVPASVVTDKTKFGGTPQRDCLTGDMIVRDGKAICLEPSSTEPAIMVLPLLAEPHVHLDKCHTVNRMEFKGGDLAAAIAAQREDKGFWTAADLRARASIGVSELMASGCGAVRTHVDWGPESIAGPAPAAWEVIGELAGETGIHVQRAALSGIEVLADRKTANSYARKMHGADGVLGSFVYNQNERREGIRNAFKMADKYSLALDFHVDEGTCMGLDGLEMIADEAISSRHQGPVLCSHACSLSAMSSDARARICDKLARANIYVAVLPATNLYLQGRQKGSENVRGLAPVKEMREAGIKVVLGTDNVCDAFCPIGRHDPLGTLSLAVVAARLDPPFGEHLPMIATDARRVIGLDPLYVDGANVENLILYKANSTTDLLSRCRKPENLNDHLHEMCA